MVQLSKYFVYINNLIQHIASIWVSICICINGKTNASQTNQTPLLIYLPVVIMAYDGDAKSSPEAHDDAHDEETNASNRGQLTAQNIYPPLNPNLPVHDDGHEAHEAAHGARDQPDHHREVQEVRGVQDHDAVDHDVQAQARNQDRGLRGGGMEVGYREGRWELGDRISRSRGCDGDRGLRGDLGERRNLRGRGEEGLEGRRMDQDRRDRRDGRRRGDDDGGGDGDGPACWLVLLFVV